MAKTNPSKTDLRAQAEAKLNKRKKSPTAEADTSRLIHELQAHQIELEMQNEELIQARAKTEALHRQFTELYDFAPVGYFTLTRDGAIRQVNLAGAILLGAEAEHSELLNRRFGLFVSPQSQSAFNAFLEKVFVADGEKQTCEVELLCRGKTESLWAHIEAVCDDAHETCRAVVVNISERKQAEEVFQQSAAREKNILESISDAFFALDDNLVVTYFNHAAEQLLNRTNADVVGKYLFDAFPEARGSLFDEKYHQAVKEKTFLAFGTYFDVEPYRNWYDVRVYPQAKGISVYFQNITTRKQAEEALRESESRLKFSQQIAHVGHWTWDTITNRVTWSDEMKRIFGLDPAAFDGDLDKVIAQAIHPDDREKVNQSNAAVTTEQKPAPMEYRVVWPDGSVHTVWAEAGEKVFGADGKIIRLSGIVQDITERKQIEDTLMFLLQSGYQDEDFFHSLARHLTSSLSMDYVCIDRLAGDLLSAQTVAIYFDGKFDDNVSYTLKDTPCGDVVGKAVCVFPNGVRHLFPQDVVLQEMPAESYIGTTLWSSQGQPIGLIAVIGRKPLAPAGQHLAESILKLVAVRAAGELERQQAEEEIRQLNASLEQRVEERTRELRDTQEQLVRHEKLAVLGQMAGSVGHELRNPLSVINSAVYYLKLIQPEADAEVKKYFGIIEQEVRNSDKIITDLLDYARIKSVNREPASVSELIRQTFERFPAPASVEVTLDIPADLPRAYVDVRQMTQVLGNLVVNAYQAMPNGGQLSFHARLQNDMIVTTIQDNGMGIPPENMKKLFEPLFTTRAKGIGLGLPISQKLAEANGGRIQVQSEAGQGSTFTVWLPVYKPI